MNRGRLQYSFLDDAALGLPPCPLSQSVSQVAFDRVARQIGQLVIAKHLDEVLDRTLVRFVRLWRPQRRLGVVLEEQGRALLARHLLALANDFQHVVVARLESVAEFLLRLLPIGGAGRFLAANARAIPIPDPPELRASTTVDDAVVFTWSCHPPPPA